MRVPTNFWSYRGLSIALVTEATLQLPPHCPPAGHHPANGRYFRLSAPSLPVGEQLPSDQWTLPLHKKKSEAYGRTEQCDAYAHSIFADLGDLLNARQVIPWARNKSIARLDLEPGMGSILETPSPLGPSHHDWWPEPIGLLPTAHVVEAKL